MLVSFKSILQNARKGRYAVGAFNCLSLEHVIGAIQAAEELKSLHKLIGKVKTDIEAFSFNTAVSAFMIAVN